MTEVGIDRTLTETALSGTGTFTDVSNLTYTPGQIWTDPQNGNVFKYVMIEDLDASAGDCVRYTTDFNGFEVSADATGGTADGAFAAGIVLVDVTDGDFGWIQVSGRCVIATVTDGNVTADELLMAHATVNGQLDTDSGLATSALFGWTTTDDTGTALAVGEVILDCLNHGLDE